MVEAKRYHDICCGHRVVGHEGKCKNLHGHNYRFHFTLRAKVATIGEVDEIGRVIDFSVIKTTLCEWLERYWDHKMLIWEKDPFAFELGSIDPTVVIVPFNPTAENIAEFFVEKVAPTLLASYRAFLNEIEIEETRKCSVRYLSKGNITL
jgi:6-pyruvoyltetrahydropterin/6-carboxytetrahydropterin synthase